ncbi:dehydrogenase [Phnomibacter ginsenosidimutans]|uniref:Dehydrogenase n=1 Tax=Phnomibacter ginsenosidimutans TaxID=2676868 RepID=A0A6I6GN72_9BACT|nr:dehydrogenase [Phnomibacter ginsenosidimutans]QGW29128.1 dehydrogenase [Phnomibacter ginsenosidimutans]
MHFRSKAPLRLGFAGGGTDVDPYASRFGGAVLNASIDLFAHASIEPLQENAIVLHDLDNKQELRFAWAPQLPTLHALPLHAAVFNRIHAQYGLPLSGFSLITSVDAPIGSGLGTSSTLVVAIISAFAEMLQLPLGEYDIARLAYDIERNDLQFAGGHQDQYAASFGGINFMEFGPGEQVIVNPLRIRHEVLQELEHNLVLYYTGHARQSGRIIEEQQANVRNDAQPSIQAMHHLKQQALLMKEALLKGRLQDMGDLFDIGFAYKKQMANGISNPHIEALYAAAKNAGATGGKISGAGGGGFVFFYCPNNTRHRVTETLNSFGGQVYPFHFCMHGVQSWTI